MVKKLLYLLVTAVVSLSLVGCGLPGIIADIPAAYERNWYKRQPYYLLHDYTMDTPDGNTLWLIGVKIKVKDLAHYQKEQEEGKISEISGPYPPE